MLARYCDGLMPLYFLKYCEKKELLGKQNSSLIWAIERFLSRRATFILLTTHSDIHREAEIPEARETALERWLGVIRSAWA